MTIKERFLRYAHLLFIIFVLAELFLPDGTRRAPLINYAIGFASVIEIMLLTVSALSGCRKKL